MKIFFILRVVDLIFLSIVFFIVLLVVAFTDKLSNAFVTSFNRFANGFMGDSMSYSDRAAQSNEEIIIFLIDLAVQFFSSLIVSFFLIVLLFYMFCFFVTLQVKFKYQNVRAGLHGAYHVPNVPKKDFDELGVQQIPLT